MNIAELFVDLGIKGADKTVSTLGDVKKGMGELGSMSLETKAAILGALYGFERMMATSGHAGTDLTNFSALVDISGQSLQQWQYAARQAGVSSEDLNGSFKGLASVMAALKAGKGAPEGLAWIVKATGMNMDRAKNDLQYLMLNLQKASQILPKDIGNMAIKSFGVSENMIAAMRRNVFTPENFAKAPTYSDKEIKALDKANVAWSNLGNKIEMAFGHFNAKHGVNLVNEISKITNEVIKLVEAFTKLAEKLKLFELIGKAFKGWTGIFGSITEHVNNIQKDKGGILQGMLKENQSFWEGLGEAAKGMMIEMKENISPNMPAGAVTQPSNVVNIHQNITHHGDAKDTQSVKDTHRAAINHAYRQRLSQRQGS